MPVIPSQSGYFWGALGQSLSHLPDQMMKYQALQQQQKAADLRAKMLDLQTQELTQKLGDAKLAQEARDATFGAMNKPTVPMGGPVNGPADENGVMPQQPPQEYRKPNMGELRQDPNFMANLYRSQPKEFTTGLMRNMFAADSGKVNAYTNPNGYATPQEASGVTGLPVERMRMGLNGRWFPEGSTPVNAMSDVYHKAFKEAKDMGLSESAAGEYALAKQRGGQFGQAAASSAGTEAGKAGQYNGQPIAPMQPFAGSVMPQGPQPTPEPSSRSTLNPAQGSYPTPAGGSPSQQMDRAKATIKREEAALPEGAANTIAQGGILNNLATKVKQSAKQEYLGNPLAGDTELEARRRLGGMEILGMKVPGEIGAGELTFRNNLRNLQNLMVYLQSGKQINEQESKRLGSAMPQPYERDLTKFNASVDNFVGLAHDILMQHAMAEGLNRGAAAAKVDAILGGFNGGGQGRLIPLAPGQ